MQEEGIMTENKWVEIISVRLYKIENQEVVQEIIDHIRSGKCPVTGRPISAELYINHTLKMDYAIHLTRNDRHVQPGKTLLGSNISEMFSSLGLTNHSVWETDLSQKMLGIHSA